MHNLSEDTQGSNDNLPSALKKRGREESGSEEDDNDENDKRKKRMKHSTSWIGDVGQGGVGQGGVGQDSVGQGGVGQGLYQKDDDTLDIIF